MTTPIDPTKVAPTPVCILSYPWLFTAQPAQEAGKVDKYSGTFIFFPPGADLSRYDDATAKALANADLSKLVAAAAAAARAKWGDKAEDMMRRGQLKSPFRKEGDSYGTVMAEKGYPEGVVFINARANQQPQVVSRFPAPGGSSDKPAVITDPTQIYPGCLVRASFRAFGYDTSGNRGISFALNNVQKWADGPRMDGRKRAEDEFEADLSTSPEGLDDILGGGGFGV
jgi:hypothetical protein